MKAKRALYRSSIIICSAGFILCGIMLAKQWWEYRSASSSYAEWEHQAAVQQESPGSGQEKKLEIDWEMLQIINPETKGWLFSQGTELSYPVVQGTDNEYYLNHLFDGTENSSGCLFIDSGWEEGKHRNCVIYGHHMKNGTMFALLENYQQQEYFEKHPVLQWITPEGTQTIELFSAYVASADSDAWRMEFESGTEYADWLKRIQDGSCFRSECSPTEDDRVMTLSTCSYAFEGARFVCHGIIGEIQKNGTGSADEGKERSVSG